MKKLFCILLCLAKTISLAATAYGEAAYSQGASATEIRVGNSAAT